eukprot:TRINITY_DN33475_c0_g1_i1.p1 TRINITY_DN33475_c0_g1~~TRINITY_DN33475_c0_g1_i1.p1  ORF type:complete len:277 (-),score=86.07 TRINITY_DN33475_c0_g1_i1:221-1051(-)
MSGREWHFANGDNSLGPLGLSTACDMLGREEINEDTLVWSSGMGDWVSLGSCDALLLELEQVALREADPSNDQVEDVAQYLSYASSQLDEWLVLNQDIDKMKKKLRSVNNESAAMSAIRKKSMNDALRLCQEDAEMRGPRVVRKLNWVSTQSDYSIHKWRAKIDELGRKVRQAEEHKRSAEDLLRRYGVAGVATEPEAASVDSVSFLRTSSSAMLPSSPMMEDELRGTVQLEHSMEHDLQRVKGRTATFGHTHTLRCKEDRCGPTKEDSCGPEHPI